jgi:hypothetical protein
LKIQDGHQRGTFKVNIATLWEICKTNSSQEPLDGLEPNHTWQKCSLQGPYQVLLLFADRNKK